MAICLCGHYDLSPTFSFIRGRPRPSLARLLRRHGSRPRFTRCLIELLAHVLSFRHVFPGYHHFLSFRRLVSRCPKSSHTHSGVLIRSKGTSLRELANTSHPKSRSSRLRTAVASGMAFLESLVTTGCF